MDVLPPKKKMFVTSSLRQKRDQILNLKISFKYVQKNNFQGIFVSFQGRLNLQNKTFYNQNKGHLGSSYIYIYTYNGQFCLFVSQAGQLFGEYDAPWNKDPIMNQSVYPT